MEIAVLVIVLIILIAVLLTVCYYWGKQFFKFQATKKIERIQTQEEKQYQIVDQSSFQPIKDHQQPQQEIEVPRNVDKGSVQEAVVFSSSDDLDNLQFGTQFVRFNLENSTYQVMKISKNEVIYERMEGKYTSQKTFTTYYDHQFNEYYQSNEKNAKAPQLKIFEGKTKKIIYQGKEDQSQFAIQHNNLEGQRYNQILPKELKLSIEVIDAFALYLNLQEQEVYLKSNKQQQLQKRKWFIPSFKNDFMEELKNFFWQFEIIGYKVEMFSEAIYFIQQDNEQHVFLAEVNFSDTLTIHSTNPQTLNSYRPLLSQFNQFSDNLKQIVICYTCKQNQASNLNICLNMLHYSNDPLKTTIQTPEQMYDFIKNQFYQQI